MKNDNEEIRYKAQNLLTPPHDNFQILYLTFWLQKKRYVMYLRILNAKAIF